jgi:hypothetical protein
MNEENLWAVHDLLQDALTEGQENSKKSVATALAIIKSHLRPVPDFVYVREVPADRFELD